MTGPTKEIRDSLTSLTRQVANSSVDFSTKPAQYSFSIPEALGTIPGIKSYSRLLFLVTELARNILAWAFKVFIQPLQEQKTTQIHKRSNTYCVNQGMRIENPLPPVRGGWEAHHHNSLTNPLMNENNRICNDKTTKTMIRHRLVEPLPMYEPLVSFPSLAWPSHLATTSWQVGRQAIYGQRWEALNVFILWLAQPRGARE